jgi:hypothetical protein
VDWVLGWFFEELALHSPHPAPLGVTPAGR